MQMPGEIPIFYVNDIKNVMKGEIPENPKDFESFLNLIFYLIQSRPNIAARGVQGVLGICSEALKKQLPHLDEEIDLFEVKPI